MGDTDDMMANDPIFEGTTAIELWRHDGEDCHLGLYYRTDGDKELYEMRVDNQVVPLHPEFPMGFAVAAHCLMHIAKCFYDGTLVEQYKCDHKDLLEGWNG